MMNIDMKYIQVVVGLLLCYCLYACSPRPESVQPADRLLVLYPEYQDVTIPYNVAPLNFLVRNEGVRECKGSIGQLGDKCAREQGDIPLESLACIA